MRNRGTSNRLCYQHWYRCFLVSALAVGAQPSLAAFYSEAGVDWGYRAPIEVDATAAPGSTIIIDVDFPDLISQTSAAGTFDPNSVRIVRDDTVLVGQQEFNDTVLSGAVDVAGNGRGEVRFILEDAPGAVNYHVYFDVTDNGSKPASPATVINGTFEQATGNPLSWTTSQVNAGGAQNNESYSTGLSSTFTVAAGCSTGGATVDNSPNDNGTAATGRGWHLLGYRDRCEDGASGNERIRLSRNLRIPTGAAAGDLNFAFQVQAWDGISNANNYDWFVIYINNTPIDHRNMGVVAGSPALVIETARFGRSAFGTGNVDHGWRDARVDLSSFAGSTINLRFEARFSSTDNAYRSWIKLDDVSWSTKAGKVGTPETDAISVAGFDVQHDNNAIYCLREPIRVRVVDATGTQIPDFAGTVVLDTQQPGGQFFLVSGSGAFSGGSSGTATYNFVPGDSGQAAFELDYASGSTPIDIDVYLQSDSGIRDDDSEGTLAFAPNGFTVTAAPLSNPPPSPIDTSIPAQVAATPFPLYITAYGVTEDDPVCGVIESYAGARQLAFWHSYGDPSTGTLTSEVDSNPIATSAALASPQAVAFTSGQARVEVEYPDVGEISISASDSASATGLIQGASTQFIVKPAELVISRIESASGQVNPGATTLGGPGFVAAGETFTVSIDSLNADGILTPNFGLESSPETPVVRSTALVLPVGGINGPAGDLTNGASFSATSTPGRFSNSAVRFDETGIISARPGLADDSYMGEGDVPRPTVSHVGRFYPAKFRLTSGLLTPACTVFTYMDQPELGINYEIQALSVIDTLTTNYSDSLYGSGNTVGVQLGAEDSDSGTDLASRLSLTAGSWDAGRYSVNGFATFNRAAAPDGPYSNLAISTRIVDALDSLDIENPDANATSAGNCTASGTCNARQIGADTRVYYGRALVLPAQGPETSDLIMGLEAQFFNGTSFQRNSSDNCSSYSTTDFSLAAYTGNLDAGETTPASPLSNTLFANGYAAASNPLTLSAPGVGNSGSVEVSFNTDSWLLFDWDGAGDSQPAATASFGSYRGHDRIIYWKEQR